VVHIGWVCQGGTLCVVTGQDRRLGDYFTNALDRRGCVLIATGDRWHAPASILAARAGKDVYTEKPVVIDDLRRSRWSRYLLHGADPPDGSAAATPMAQHGAIWGAVAVYRGESVAAPMDLLGQLAELATEPLSSLGGAGRRRPGPGAGRAPRSRSARSGRAVRRASDKAALVAALRIMSAHAS